MKHLPKYIFPFLVVVGITLSLSVFSQELDMEFFYYGADDTKVNALGQLEIDKDGHIWIGSWGQGLYVFDGYHFKHYMHNPDNLIDLKSNYIVGLYQNHLDRMMVATTKSLMEFDYPKQTIYHSKFVDDTNEAISLARSEGILELDDNLWLATGNGILKCSYADGTCQRFKTDDIHSPEAYFDNYFYKIIKDPYKDILWLNSAYGMKYLDMKDNTIHQINSPLGFHDMGKQYKQHKMWDMYLDYHHRLWFAAITSGGVLCYEIDKNKWTEYKQPITNPNQGLDYGNKVACLVYVNDSLILYANQIGIGKVDLQNKNLKLLTSYDIDKGGWVKKLEFDQNGVLWGTGLNAIFRTKKSLLSNSEENRPPVILNIIKNKKKIDYLSWNQDTITNDIEELKLEIGVINPIDTNKIRYKWQINHNKWSEPSHKREINLKKHLIYGINHINFKSSNNGQDWITGSSFKTFLEQPYYLKPKFITFLLLSICLTSALTWYLIKRNKQIKLEQKRSHERLLAQMEMRSLRAQMNPHFIFNSLNSISSFIYKNENELATDYLAKFAKLMRSVLRNSEEKLIPLSEEISIASLYLELEKLRFDDRFEFNFSIGKNIDPNELYIPPLLLQPYLENAVWHGILHQSKGGKLEINITQKNDKIEILIIDNGIGREASRKNKKSSSKKKSYGLNITKNRLELVNLVYETSASTHIDDLYDKKGQSIGTKVRIKIPILKKNNY